MTPHVFEQDAYYEIYSLVAKKAGLDVDWKGRNPAIEMRRLTASGRDVFVVVNHRPKEQIVNIRVPANPGGGPARSWRHEAEIEIKDGKTSFVLRPSEGDLIEIL